MKLKRFIIAKLSTKPELYEKLGYVPKTVKRGDDEYMIVVSGVSDTGMMLQAFPNYKSMPSQFICHVVWRTFCSLTRKKA